MSETISSDDLYEYGAWSRDHKNDLGPTPAGLVIGCVTTKSKSYSMTDDKADKIDKAVCKLSRHNAHLGEVFIQHYIYGATYRELARYHKCSRTVISNKLAHASGYVVGAVSDSYYDISCKKQINY